MMKTVRQEVTKEPHKTGFSIPKFTFNNVEIPNPGPGQVLVKVRACGLSLPLQKIFRSSLNEDSGTWACGQDVSGIVIRVGEGVTHVLEEDDVVGVLPLDSQYSGYGEFCIFNEYDLVKKPRMLSYDQAAGCIGDLVRAYTALHYQGRVCAGDTVLILDGATPFGFISVQLARHWGTKVITTVVSAAEKSFLESNIPALGQVIELGVAGNILVSAVMEETGGLGVDVVIDNGVRMYSNEEDSKLPSERRRFPTPHKHDIIACLGVAGKWVTSQPDLQLDPPDSQLLYLRGASVNFLFDAAWTLSYSQQGRYQHILHEAIDKLDRHNIKCKIEKTVTLDQVPEELSQLENHRVGKIVLTL